MRIVIHLDKRTDHAPCLFDYELNIHPKDPPIVVEYGRAYVEKMKRLMAATPGFQESKRPLRGVPSAIARYNAAAGVFEPLDIDRADFAPRIRVALFNFMTSLNKELANCTPAQADATPAACADCIHMCQRAGALRSVFFRGRYRTRGRLLPYCRRLGRFVTYAEYESGCQNKETAK